MTTVTTSSPSRKVFFAQLDGVSGTLAKLDDTIYFFHPDSGAIREVTSYAGLLVLGEVGLSMAQLVLDEMHGGAAQIACQRANLEVR